MGELQSNKLKHTFSINGSEPVNITSDYTSLKNNTNLVEGDNILVVKCTDKAGNFVDKTITIKIDNTPPVLSITSSPENESSVCALIQNINVLVNDDVSSPSHVKYSYSVDDFTPSSVYTVSVNELGEASLSFPASSDFFYLDESHYKNKQNGIFFSITAVDEAGNESQPFVLNWILDRVPPLGIILGGLSMYYAATCSEAPVVEAAPSDPEVWFKESCPDTKGMKFFVNDTFYSEWDNPSSDCVYYACDLGSYYTPCVICQLDGNTLETFTAKTTFSDSCGNWGEITDCKDNDYYCVEQGTNTGQPDLYINIEQTGDDNFKLTLDTNAEIIDCNIYKGEVLKQTCSNTNVQNIDVSLWEEGSYKIVASSKYDSGVFETTKSKSFVVDRTEFSISFNLVNQGDYILYNSPTINFNIDIATGVKEAKFYIRGRTVNYRHIPSGEDDGYPCNDTTKLCTDSSYQKLIYTTTSDTGTFTADVMEGGNYNKIYYLVTPNFGEKVQEEYTLSRDINLIKTTNDDSKMIFFMGAIHFTESIVSEKVVTSDFVAYNTSPYNDVCFVNGNYFYEDTDSESVSAKMSVEHNTAFSVISFFPAEAQYEFSRRGCDSMNDCPYTAASCQPLLKTSHSPVCIGSTAHHYSEGIYEGGYSCKDWETPGNYGSFNVPLYYAHCPFYRDLSYFPDGLRVRINDNVRPKTYYMKDFLTTHKQSDCF